MNWTDRGRRREACRLALAWIAAIVMAGCAPVMPASPALRATTVSESVLFDQLEPVWDNSASQAGADVRLYIEPYCQTADCVTAIQETLPALMALPDTRLRVYDYPLSQVAESFMVAGIGRCVAQQSQELYLRYLSEAARSQALKDELEMYRIAKEVTGKRYDTRCLQREIRKIKALFENNNPLGLTRVPAIFVRHNGQARLIEGALTADQVQSLLSQDTSR